MLIKAMLIGFAGARRAGKDLAASHLVNNHGFVQYAFATPLKELCKDLFGLTHDQIHEKEKDLLAPKYGITPRRIMQMMGTDCVRTISPTFWVDALEKKLSETAAEKVVVSDVRFQNEVDLIHRRGGHVILISRECCEVCDRHISEQAQTLHGIDGVIRNEGSVADMCRAVDRAVLAQRHITKFIQPS